MSVNPEYVRDLYREKALEKAMDLTARNRVSDPAEVVRVAEMFRAFLAGEPNIVKVSNPEEFLDPVRTFKLPHSGDGFQYFKYANGDILYRSDMGFGARGIGGVSRIRVALDNEWKPRLAREPRNSREELRLSDEYHEITPALARAIIRENVTGVRFV